MRTEKEMLDLILDAAKSDERIRAALLEGSRANPAVPKDQYQDYDICYYVTDIKPFYDNPAWVEARFGKPLIMQMPEAMRWPDGGGHFTYMMIYPDGSRIDLTFQPKKYVDEGEPVIALLDKDNGNGLLPALPPPSDDVYHIKPPPPLFYYSCCNNFWWCLNNVAKGIARDELPYAMHMLNETVRAELHF
ncbi:MAG: aminoglycoside 6-adenylyltransferase, partial [Oscillospiraceae bacterium]|nr:aminoglycoside 6-adenylyltransferase [Oscillospiraceae bacterium]